MAIKSLVKDKNFLLGFVVAALIFFGALIPVIGDILGNVFEAIGRVSPLGGLGFIGNIIHAYVLSILSFWLVFRVSNKAVARSLAIFSIGFFIASLLYVVLALVAISRFNFTQ